MDDKPALPRYEAPLLSRHQSGGPTRRSRRLRLFALACLSLIVIAQWKQLSHSKRRAAQLSAEKLTDDFARCGQLHHKPHDPIGLGRDHNARYVEGGLPTLIKNATIWVGEPVEGTSPQDARAGKGWEWMRGDVFLEHGLIRRVEADIDVESLSQDNLLYNAEGRFLTAGIIDMHSHVGVHSLPELDANQDRNEVSTNISPYARSLDGFYIFDPQIHVIKSGGVTTSLILPGSSNNIGGEAYLVKHAVGRSQGRNETSAASMLADPEQNWRYLKMACGENPKIRINAPGRPTTRMGESFDFRRTFEQARDYVRRQDDWCAKADSVGPENMNEYLPQEIAWETLGAVMRGQVHVNVHCYTVNDLEAMVDHTNEFKFGVRVFHHAHQTYLVPEILKRTWGGRPPASALFADNMYYKLESYIGSEFAGKHLYDQGLTPVYVSDNPALNGQHVVFEAAKAYHYGLPYHAALASVTTAPAEELGMGKRLGKIKPGFDADIVIWDSDPLSVGATPVQVWIDGTNQLKAPVYHDKPVESPVGHPERLSDMEDTEPVQVSNAMFKGISKVLLSDHVGHDSESERVNVAITNGKISCIGTCDDELKAAAHNGIKVVQLQNGYLTHSFTGVAGTLGLNEIDAEASTDNGDNPESFTRAIDGLLLQSKKLQVGLRYGVTRAISAPKFTGLGSHHGTSVGFATSAQTSLEMGAIFAADAAVHYTLDVTIRQSSKSYSEAFGALRRKLLSAARTQVAKERPDPFSEAHYLNEVVSGKLTLALTINSADGIASALRIKSDVEAVLKSTNIKMAIVGGAESHLMAQELAAASVGVILAPLQAMPLAWDSRRALSGAPLTNGTTADWLVTAGVTVGIGLLEDWGVRDLGFEAGTAYRNGDGRFTEKSALDMVSSNIYKILGVEVSEEDDKGHFMISEGSPLHIGSRIMAVGAGRGKLSLFLQSGV